MIQRYISILTFIGLLLTAACTPVSKQLPPHPVEGKWAQKGKCNSLPWLFTKHSVRWGNNGGSWKDMGDKIKVISYIAQENTTMTLYFSQPKNNVMHTLSLNYGGSQLNNSKGKLIKCPS